MLAVFSQFSRRKLSHVLHIFWQDGESNDNWSLSAKHQCSIWTNTYPWKCALEKQVCIEAHSMYPLVFPVSPKATTHTRTEAFSGRAGECAVCLL